MSIFKFLGRTSKEDIIANSHTDKLYMSENPHVKFYSQTIEQSKDDGTTVHQAAPRTHLQLTQKKSNGEFEALEITQIVHGKQKGKVRLPHFTLDRIEEFLHILKDLKVEDHTHRRCILVPEESLGDVGTAAREGIISALSGVDGTRLVQDLMNSGALNERDIVNTGYRRQQLGVFESLLFNGGVEEYKVEEMGKPNTKDEIAWQHFFNKNQWIFGYGLDYRFNTVLQKEFAASSTTAAGKEQVNADFLLGDSRFTTFVELKKPDTPLFGTVKNRSGAWKLSSDLQDAVSQILEQKAAGQIKIATTPDLMDATGEAITQKAHDSKVILLVGSWSQIEGDSTQLRLIKRKTLELYRRDSRNVDIITYDELYERACHIVDSGMPDSEDTPVATW